MGSWPVTHWHQAAPCERLRNDGTPAPVNRPPRPADGARNRTGHRWGRPLPQRVRLDGPPCGARSFAVRAPPHPTQGGTPRSSKRPPRPPAGCAWQPGLMPCARGHPCLVKTCRGGGVLSSSALGAARLSAPAAHCAEPSATGAAARGGPHSALMLGGGLTKPHRPRLCGSHVGMLWPSPIRQPVHGVGNFGLALPSHPGRRLH